MSVIIISKGSYSHGRDVAEIVSRKLNYGCFSRDILIDISKKFKISELKLIRAVEDAPAFLEKYTFGREKYISYIRAEILDNLAQDNMVYHGFAGHFFVDDISHVLKVRITADMELRLERMMKREAVSREKAAWLVKKVDEERKRWSVKLYGIDTWDCRLYDMVINIGRITIDHAVDLICQTVKQTAFQTTPESKARIEKVAEEALSKIEAKDFLSPFFEPMRDSPWSKKREPK